MAVQNIACLVPPSLKKRGRHASRLVSVLVPLVVECTTARVTRCLQMMNKDLPLSKGQHVQSLYKKILVCYLPAMILD